MKKITLSCDQCMMEAPGTVGALPMHWHDVSVAGFTLGIFCPTCSTRVNVPDCLEKVRREHEQAAKEYAEQARR